jgi:hypothetical protein
MTRNRVPISREASAHPKLMRRIGVLPKLWEAEQRAIAYSDETRNLAASNGRHRRKKQEPAE